MGYALDASSNASSCNYEAGLALLLLVVVVVVVVVAIVIAAIGVAVVFVAVTADYPQAPFEPRRVVTQNERGFRLFCRPSIARKKTTSCRAFSRRPFCVTRIFPLP